MKWGVGRACANANCREIFLPMKSKSKTLCSKCKAEEMREMNRSLAKALRRMAEKKRDDGR